MPVRSEDRPHPRHHQPLRDPRHGRCAAHRYFLTGERFDAAEALRIGFVHRVVAADELDNAVDGLLKHLVSAGPAAARACKRLVIEVAEREINEQLIAATVESIADIRASAEGKEGVQAFLQSASRPGWPDTRRLPIHRATTEQRRANAEPTP